MALMSEGSAGGDALRQVQAWFGPAFTGDVEMIDNVTFSSVHLKYSCVTLLLPSVKKVASQRSQISGSV